MTAIITDPYMNTESPPGPRAFDHFYVRVGAYTIGLLLILPLTYWTYGAVVGPPAVTTCHSSIRVMTWGGPSPIGYVRVELWSEQGPETAPIQKLLIYQTDGTVFTYRGSMVRAPLGISAASSQQEIFVHSKSLLNTGDGDLPKTLAAVSRTGVLRLYAFGLSDGTEACDLPPIN